MNCQSGASPSGRHARRYTQLLGWGFTCFVILAAYAYSAIVFTRNAYGEETRVRADAIRPAKRGIKDATKQVYRLLVEVEGAIKGGTGFLVSGRRVIATNYHVIDKGTAYSVGFIDNDGGVKRIPLRLLAIFPQKDLALLQALDDLPGVALRLSKDSPDLAAEIYAIGFPAAADPQGVLSWAQGDDTTFFLPSVLKGYVSRILTNRWFSSQLQHQTPIVPGYSGGPLIDPQGVVVAISSSIHKEANGISYGVLARDLSEMLEACSLPGKAIAGSDERGGQSETVRETARVKTLTIKDKASAPSGADLAMLQRGKDFLQRGDIVAARLIFRYLVNQRGFSDAYIGLAQTYDPIFLNEKNVIGVSGDAEKAREFYEKAALIGNPDNPAVSPTLRHRSDEGICNGATCELVNGANGPVVQCRPDGPPVDQISLSRK